VATQSVTRAAIHGRNRRRSAFDPLRRAKFSTITADKSRAIIASGSLVAVTGATLTASIAITPSSPTELAAPDPTEIIPPAIRSHTVLDRVVSPASRTGERAALAKTVAEAGPPNAALAAAAQALSIAEALEPSQTIADAAVLAEIEKATATVADLLARVESHAATVEPTADEFNDAPRATGAFAEIAAGLTASDDIQSTTPDSVYPAATQTSTPIFDVSENAAADSQTPATAVVPDITAIDDEYRTEDVANLVANVHYGDEDVEASEIAATNVESEVAAPDPIAQRDIPNTEVEPESAAPETEQGEAATADADADVSSGAVAQEAIAPVTATGLSLDASSDVAHVDEPSNVDLADQSSESTRDEADLPPSSVVVEPGELAEPEELPSDEDPDAEDSEAAGIADDGGEAEAGLATPEQPEPATPVEIAAEEVLTAALLEATATLDALLLDAQALAPTGVTPAPMTAVDVLAFQAGEAQASAVELAQLVGSTSGLANGQLPEAVLCHLPGTERSKLRCDAAAQFARLNEAFKAEFGYDIAITDSYRSYAEQVSVKATKGYLAATPGTSNHGWGLALDLGSGISDRGSAQYQWMAENAGLFGWVNPDWAQPGGSKLEPWHWEYEPLA